MLRIEGKLFVILTISRLLEKLNVFLIISIGRDIIKPTEKLTSNHQMSNNYNENTLSPLSNSNSITNNTNETME